MKHKYMLIQCDAFTDSCRDIGYANTPEEIMEYIQSHLAEGTTVTVRLTADGLPF